MVTMSSKEARDRFGVLMDTARREPVMVTKHGRPAVVVLSSEEYATLEAMEDRYWLELARQGRESGYLGVEESEAFIEEMLGALGHDEHSSDN